MRTAVLMLGDTSQVWEKVGDPVRADAWWGNTDGIHTISVHVNNFIGGIKIQGTLANNPASEDWFDIDLSSLNSNAYNSQNITELRFPKDPFNPTSSNGGDTLVEAFTFVGNFVFLRAVLTRAHLSITPITNLDMLAQQVGTVNKILLSL